MRIIYCIPTLECGGAERQLAGLAVELTRVGHEVHVVFSRGGESLDTLKAGGVATHEVGGSRNHDPKIFFRLVRLIRGLKPDLVQTTLTQMDILGGAAALATRTPWVLQERSSAPCYPAGWKNRLRARLGARADAVVANSAEGEDYWRSQSGTCAPLHVIPNGIPLDEIAGAGPEGADGFGLGRGQKLVLYAGRMDDGKNVGNLIAALARIADDVPFSAVLCGDGPLRPALEQLAGELGLSHRLVFPGYVRNPWALMKRADVFAFVSRFEGSPCVVMEAMACGCPLVVSDIPSHREILDDRSACFVNPEEPAEIAAAVRSTLSSGEAALVRAASARARVAELSFETMARRYEQLYLSVVSKY
ncbi:MAG TPA: glycosyltransferase [Pyrinomonadaceae bacterium]|jgi:glycosyltransferase involved in cell wall biosynthesis